MNRYFAILFLSAICYACNDNEKTKESTETTQSETPVSENSVQLTDTQAVSAGVVTGKLELKNISSVLRVNGVVDVPPQNLVSISVPLGGYLRSSRLLPGMYVKKGQPLATMEDAQYIQIQQDYLTAKARLSFAEQEYQRQKQLNETKASSDKALQQAQAEFTAQQVLVRSLAEKLRLINISPSSLGAGNISRSISISSPISGFVAKVNVNIGKYVNPSDVLFEIVNPSDIYLRMSVFEKDLNLLSIGQKLTAYTNADPQKKYSCTIVLIGKDYAEDRSVEAHAHFASYDKSLIPGTFMNAEIEAQSSNAYVIPSDAIVSYENTNYVFVNKGKNQFEITEVSTGTTQNGYTEITGTSAEGLKDKEIAIKGAYSLLMKMKNTPDE
jgi:membrane fusion protein, heavy metal efflux system